MVTVGTITGGARRPFGGIAPVARVAWSWVSWAVDHERKSVVALSNVVLRSPTLWLACGTIVAGMFVAGFGAGVAGKGRLRNRLAQAEITISGQEANIAVAEASSKKQMAKISLLEGKIEAMRAEAAASGAAKPKVVRRSPRSRPASKVASTPPASQLPSWVPWK